MPAKKKTVKRAKTMAEIAAASAHRPPVHKSYGDREDLRLLAVCNNINGPIAPSGLMTLDDKKVTCKRCLRIIGGKPIGRAPIVLNALAAAMVLRHDALKLVEQLALYWTTEGNAGDEPGSAKEAFELLVKHGYQRAATDSGVPSLRRPDGSVVVR